MGGGRPAWGVGHSWPGGGGPGRLGGVSRRAAVVQRASGSVAEARAGAGTTQRTTGGAVTARRAAVATSF
jgi:hypothetical protein